MVKKSKINHYSKFLKITSFFSFNHYFGIVRRRNHVPQSFRLLKNSTFAATIKKMLEISKNLIDTVLFAFQTIQLLWTREK